MPTNECLEAVCGMGAFTGGNAHARRHRNPLPVEVDRCCEARLHSIHDWSYRPRLEVVKQQGELVSTESCRQRVHADSSTFGSTSSGSCMPANRKRPDARAAIPEREIRPAHACDRAR